MIGIPPVCLKCKHFHQDSGMPYTCDAFPDGPIPQAIWVEGDPHTSPHPGDQGIRFAPVTKNLTEIRKKARRLLKND